MEKLFIDDELKKIRHDNFDLKSLRKNGKQIIGCSFYKDGIGYVLNAYIVKCDAYNPFNSNQEHLFIASNIKLNKGNLEDTVNEARKYLVNKNKIAIGSNGLGYGAIEILKKDYIADNGKIYYGNLPMRVDVKEHGCIMQSVFPFDLTSNLINEAAISLRELIKEDRFHVDEEIYNDVLKELSLFEYETNSNGTIHLIRNNDTNYLDNIILVCLLNEHMKAIENEKNN